MASFNNVPQTELVNKTAEKLKELKELNPPEWAFYAKTGVHKERPPADKDWWYVRAAAILRTIAIVNPIGVSKLRTKYGGKKRRGHKPAKFKRGSGSVIRKVLQQLEAAGLAEKKDKKCKGRFITTKGIRVLNDVAKELFSKYPKVKKTEKKETVEPVTEAKVEEKPEAKVEEKPEAKVEEKPEAKVEEKPEAKVEEKAETVEKLEDKQE